MGIIRVRRLFPRRQHGQPGQTGEIGLWWAVQLRLLLPTTGGLFCSRIQLYDHLAISRFAAKIDRRKLRSRENRLPDTALSLNEMLGEERYYAWIFDEDYYYSDVENLKAARHLGQKIEIESLPPGEYKLQIMNPRNAEIIEERKLVLDDAALPLLLTLPEFQRSIALKIENAIKLRPPPKACSRILDSTKTLKGRTRGTHEVSLKVHQRVEN